MAPASAPAAAAIVTFAVTALVYTATASFTPVWPPQQEPSTATLWLLHVIGRIPSGDAQSRAVVLAMLFAALTSAITAATIVRLGYQPIVGAACVLALACTPAVWRQATGDVTGALASLLIAAALAIVVAVERSWRVRVLMAGGFIGGAIALGALDLKAPANMRDAAASAVALMRVEWRLPVAALIAAGVASPLWSATRAPLLATMGTLGAVILAVAGGSVAALAPFAAVVMSHGLSCLPTPSSRARAAIAIALALVAVAGPWQDRRPPDWQLTAWRDALERTIPGGAVIVTSNRAAAALQPALLAGRPAGIEIRLAAADDSTSPFVLEDLRKGSTRTAVKLTFANALDAIGRLPRGTVVGVAIASPAIADRPDLVRAALRAIGVSGLTDASAGVAAIGLSGVNDADTVNMVPVASNRAYLWLGEPIGHTGRRSPTDIDAQATNAGVRIRIRDRVVAASDGWAAVALDRYGRVIASWASDDSGGAWPIDIAGLAVWR